MEKPIKKRPPKTLKEKKLVREYIKTGNKTEAGDRVLGGATRRSNGNMAVEILAKLSIGDELENAGYTNPHLAKTLFEESTATKMFTSHTEPDKTVPDWNARHRSMELASELRGHKKEGDKYIQKNYYVVLPKKIVK